MLEIQKGAKGEEKGRGEWEGEGQLAEREKEEGGRGAISRGRARRKRPRARGDLQRRRGERVWRGEGENTESTVRGERQEVTKEWRRDGEDDGLVEGGGGGT